MIDLTDLSLDLPPGFERAPDTAPTFIPSPTGEDFIRAVMHGPAEEMRLIRLQSPRGEGKTTSAIWACVALAQRMERDGKSGLLPIVCAVVRDTWKSLNRTTLPTFEEASRKGLPVEFRESRTEAIIRWGDREAVHCHFFGMDNRQDADKFQGFTSGILWLEEVAPAADLSTGIPAEVLGIGASSVRQPGVPPRILITLNPPDPAHWVLKIEGHLQELGLPEIKVLAFIMPPGEKARHFRQLAADAGTAQEQEDWLQAAEAFEAYRTRSEAILAAFRPDLAARLFGGEVRGITLGERVVPAFSRALPVAPGPLPIYPGLKIVRGYDFGLSPSCVFLQILPGNGGLNVLGSVCGVNMGLSQLILYHVLPFQERYGIKVARRAGTGYTGSRGGFEFGW